MLYEYEGRTIQLSLDEYLKIGDGALRSACISDNNYQNVQDPWYGSALNEGDDVEDEDDEEEDDSPDMDMSMISLEL